MSDETLALRYVEHCLDKATVESQEAELALNRNGLELTDLESVLSALRRCRESVKLRLERLEGVGA